MRPWISSPFAMLTLGAAVGAAGLRPSCSRERAGNRRVVAERATTPPAVRASAPPRTAALAMSRPRTRFETASHMLASVEMQLSGEPLAEAMALELQGFDRNAAAPDRYTDPRTRAVRTDLAGYASAVESYEYSKQPMNLVAFESGAGTSLAFGALLDPSRSLRGRPAHDNLRALVERLALASHAGVRALTANEPARGFVAVPAPSDNPLNTLGFGGLWPTLHPFASFDPTVRPSGNAARGCSIEGGYGASAGQAIPVGDYECGYRSLHLPARNDQVERTLTPGADGFTLWKNGIWIVNYLELMHDARGRAVKSVPEAELARVGEERNRVRGTLDGEAGGASDEGVYLGSTDLEGFQAGLMVQSADELAWSRLSSLSTADGRSLGGFASVRDALAYDYAAPLRWFPERIVVREEADVEATFPRAAGFTVADASVTLLGQLALLAGASELFSLTDHANPQVGGAQTARAYFDGQPFLDDNQRPDGDPTPHDRWLALAKVSLVSLDRALCDRAGLCASTASYDPASGALSRGTSLSTYDAAYTVVVLRTARRSLVGRLTLYADTTPDPRATRSALDGSAFAGAPGGAVSAVDRLGALIDAHARVLYEVLTDADGRAYARCDLRSVSRSGDGDLEAHAAAVRGLLEAYLATGEGRYRDRAERVFARMLTEFWSDEARTFVRARGERETAWTPRLFGIVQGALREGFKLLAARPGREPFAALVASRFARLSKLVLNGWDDRDDDGVVDYPQECLLVVEGLPRGGLQMAERALTGELGVEGETPTADRDHDCVPEIDDAELPAALAAEVRLVAR